MENIRVAIRFRPYNKKESISGKDFPISIQDGKTLFYPKDKGDRGDTTPRNSEFHNFTFDNVFSEKATQEELFNSVAKNTVEWVCQGYNATIFAYGSTSSGKSYTMFGKEDDSSFENAGIIPRTCKVLFDTIEKNPAVIEAAVRCSFVEIYLEHIRDLLRNSDTELKLRQNEIKGVYIQGVHEKYVYSPEDILETIKSGSQMRTTGSTSLNSVSSRSHAILTLNVIQKYSDGSETVSKLHLIDLAGSENVGKSEVQGIGLVEAQMINKSLSSLGNVINALTDKDRSHVPYRDSKLTFLLQDSLGGNSKTILIATVSPSKLSYSETLNTLKFAKRAKEIRNIPVINKNESTLQLQRTIEKLQERILELETGLNLEKEVQKVSEGVPIQNKEILKYKTKCELLEKKMKELFNLESVNRLNDMLKKQRELSALTSEKLYDLQMENFRISKQLELLKFFFQSIQGAPIDIIKSRIENVAKELI